MYEWSGRIIPRTAIFSKPDDSNSVMSAVGSSVPLITPPCPATHTGLTVWRHLPVVPGYRSTDAHRPRHRDRDRTGSRFPVQHPPSGRPSGTDRLGAQSARRLGCTMRPGVDGCCRSAHQLSEGRTPGCLRELSRDRGNPTRPGADRIRHQILSGALVGRRKALRGEPAGPRATGPGLVCPTFSRNYGMKKSASPNFTFPPTVTSTESTEKSGTRV